MTNGLIDTQPLLEDFTQMSLYLSNHCVTDLARTLSVHDSYRINIAGSILIDRRSGGDH